MNPHEPDLRRIAPGNAAKLYGAIVAQARLPVFYRSLSVPDTLQGRFLVLSLHLFALLYRLKGEGAEALNLAQGLSDRFTADMEVVMREIGVGDLSIPKKMRGLAAASAALFSSYAEALPAGEEALARAIAEAVPLGEAEGLAGDATSALSRYLIAMTNMLEGQSLAALCNGEIQFPKACGGGLRNGGPNDQRS
ncbi:MAG TPA: ubiquinol-cytochrome C chaperone family protein [Methyloceanibacter sp.]|nr:ubiquinol-cytochrome C chaperone family protein [Methyloceanibacter sp.]